MDHSDLSIEASLHVTRWTAPRWCAASASSSSSPVPAFGAAPRRAHRGSERELSVAEAERLRDSLATHGNRPAWIAYRDQALLACFFDLGWRVGEASQAPIDHLDLRNDVIVIPRENVKTHHKGRDVGLNPETSRLLNGWVETWRPTVARNFLFVSAEGRQFVPSSIRKLFRRLAKAGEIPREAARVSPHTCRHYFAVQCARNHPGDLACLQRVLGHSSIRTTQIYFERADDGGN